MISVVVGEIRRIDSDAEFVLYRYHPEEDRQILSDPKIVVIDARPSSVLFKLLPAGALSLIAGVVTSRGQERCRRRTIGPLIRAEALLDVSGISFNDGRLGVSVYNFLSTLPARMTNTPVVRLSQAFGPLDRRMNRVLARLALNGSAHTFVRGDRSLKMISDAVPHAATRMSQAPDLAFLYRDEYCLTTVDEDLLGAVDTWIESACRTSINGLVAVVPSSLLLREFQRRGLDYIGLVAAHIREIAESGRHVIVVPNATKYGSSSDRNNDLLPIGLLKHHWFASEGQSHLMDRVCFVDIDINTRWLRRIFGRCDAVITSRFHAMVAALDLDVDVLVIGWSHKYQEVLEAFGKGESAVDAFELASSAEGIDRIAEFLASLKKKSRIATGLRDEIRARARSQIESVVSG
jgi:polysaccharide pyruvyl transferase WcaK-like protein